jgi:hypothetical protein
MDALRLRIISTVGRDWDVVHPGDCHKCRWRNSTEEESRWNIEALALACPRESTVKLILSFTK